LGERYRLSFVTFVQVGHGAPKVTIRRWRRRTLRGNWIHGW